MKKEHTILAADPADAEGFDITTEALERGQRARLVRRTRLATGLSQTQFARRFHIPVGTLRDWEQARSTPPEYAVAYMRMIARHPDLVAESVA